MSFPSQPATHTHYDDHREWSIRAGGVFLAIHTSPAKSDLLAVARGADARSSNSRALKRIGILTSGGDDPGMNPAILAVVKGDLHYHSSLSGDGRSTLGEMVAEAKKRGYQYVAITDHGEDLTINGASRKQMRRSATRSLGCRSDTRI